MPDWIKVDNDAKQAIVNLSQVKELHFKMPMFVEMYLLNYPNIKHSMPFSVTLSSAGFQCMNNPSFVFTTGDPDYQFGIIYNNATHLEGSYKLTQISEPYILNEQMQELSLPAFSKFSKETLKYNISKPKFEQCGKYLFGLKLGYKEFPGAEVFCMKTVDVVYKTKFIG
jgi:hypothetical protein